ncbi:MAG: plasmid pRiA4b ORF-3 family protein, partial [Clostridia bacterium]
SKIITEVGENMVFNYDFGDNWEIKLTLKEIYIDNKLHGREFPRVLDGEGYGIIEDCGGVGGLENLIRAFELKSGEEFEEYCQWIGRKDIDFKSFDKRYFAMVAKSANAIFKDAYENIDN